MEYYVRSIYEDDIFVYTVWCKMHFEILNRLGMDHKCDRLIDGQTDREIEPALAIARTNDSR